MFDSVRLYLVRHGHVNYFDENNQPVNPKYAHLSPEGVQQIEMLAKQLEVIQFDDIYASTLPRSIQSAKILTQYQREKNIQSLDELREIKSGRLKEISFSAAEQEIKYAYQFKSSELKRFMGGELWHEFELRVISVVNSIILKQFQSASATQKNSSLQQISRHILISSHDVVNRILLNWAYGYANQDVYVQEQDYACLNIIDFYIKGREIKLAKILLQNFTAHNVLKINKGKSSMDIIYQKYLKNNGFRENLS